MHIRTCSKSRRAVTPKQWRDALLETVTTILEWLPPAELERIARQYFSTRRPAIGRTRRAVIREIARFPFGAMRGREIAAHMWSEVGTCFGLADAELGVDDSRDARRLAAIVDRQSDPADRDLLLRLAPQVYLQSWYSRRADVVRHVVGQFYGHLGSAGQGAKQLQEDMACYAGTLAWERGFPPNGNRRAAALHQLLVLFQGEVPSVQTLCRAAAGMEEP